MKHTTSQRLSFGLVGLLLVLMLTLTACGSDNTPAASNNTSSNGAPAINNTTLVTLEPDMAAAMSKQMTFPGVSNLDIKIYTSSDDVMTTSTNADSAFTKAGFNFALPGQSKPTTENNNFYGLYAKSGSPDFLVAGSEIPSDTATLSKGMDGVSDTSIKKMVDQVKGKKTLIIVGSANGIADAAAKARSGSSTPAPTK